MELVRVLAIGYRAAKWLLNLIKLEYAHQLREQANVKYCKVADAESWIEEVLLTLNAQVHVLV